MCANITEAWRKRRYTAAFIFKLSDPKARPLRRKYTWNLQVHRGDIANAEFEAIDDAYEHILGQIVRIIDDAEKWVIG